MVAKEQDKVTILTTLFSEFKLAYKNLVHLFSKAISIGKEELIVDY